MNNPYRRFKKIINDDNVESEELLHALLASVFAEGCETCNQKFHSEEFAKGFHQLLREMRFCRSLSSQPMTLSWKRVGFFDSLKQYALRLFAHPTGRPIVRSSASRS
jgi:hypothetical protein